MSTVEIQQLSVNEIFYSLQGEGARVGEPSIFIRLQGCSAKNACLKSGVECDTEFVSGYTETIEYLYDYFKDWGCRWIVWTGGEPLDQLTQEMIDYFKKKGFLQALETSGIHKPLDGFDHIALSPKIAEHVIIKKWESYYPHELRYVRREGQHIPETKIEAETYYVSPHSDGNQINKNNLDWCIGLCKSNPKWRLSVQMHKLWELR